MSWSNACRQVHTLNCLGARRRCLVLGRGGLCRVTKHEESMPIDTDSQWFKLQHSFADWLVADGLARWVTEVPDVGRAPLLYTPNGRRIQPDLLTELVYERELVWIDGKGKSDVVAYGNRRGVLRTGIDWDELQAYRDVVMQTVRPCLVAFIHVRQREVRYLSVDSALWQRGHGGGQDMAFVDYEPLPLLARWNGDPEAARFELVSDAFFVIPKNMQLGLDGVFDVPHRRARKGYATLPMRRPPTGVKGWPPP